MMKEAIILAGGRGSRLKSLTDSSPKPMLFVKDKPFLTYLLDQLIDAGVTRTVLSVGYLANQISDYFKSDYRGMKLDYCFEKHPRGTGGAIHKSLELVHDPHPLVLNGDTFFKIPLNELIQFHRVSGNDLSIALCSLPDCQRYGRVILNTNGFIERFEEKGKSGPGLMNGGIYVLNRKKISSVLPDLKTYSFESDFIMNSLDRIKVGGISFNHYFIDIGIPEDLAKANQDLPR